MMAAHIHWQAVESSRVAQVVADTITTAAADAIAARERLSLVLAGGTTPRGVYALLAKTCQQWEKWRLYYGDERCLPPDDPERNSRMVAGTGLADKAGEHYPIPAELGPEAGAAAYRPVVEAALPFDLVLLGVGEDGHTASLFPGHRHPTDALVVPVHGAPKPPPDRVSLGVAALAQCRRMIVLATGAGKVAALRRWRAGESLPIAVVTAAANGEVTVVTDRPEVLEG